MACPPKHTEYGSETLAKNVVLLHEWSTPSCGGFEHFPCGDHWHVGHSSHEIGDMCKRTSLGRPVRT